MSCLIPMNAIAIAAGNIKTLDQVAELGYYGYDSIVLGRNIVDVRHSYYSLSLTLIPTIINVGP